MHRRTFGMWSCGIFKTIINSMENLLESNVINLIMKEVSSLVTCGTSVNTGHNYGLLTFTFNPGRMHRRGNHIACNNNNFSPSVSIPRLLQQFI